MAAEVEPRKDVHRPILCFHSHASLAETAHFVQSDAISLGGCIRFHVMRGLRELLKDATWENADAAREKARISCNLMQRQRENA